MNNWFIYWVFTHFFTGILIFKGFTARRLCKSFGVKGLIAALTALFAVRRRCKGKLHFDIGCCCLAEDFLHPASQH
jgi:hypothetical protein